MSLSSARKVISKYTAVLFIVTGLSGIILLAVHPVHGQAATPASIIVKHIHEAASVPFTVAALLHACVNWRVLVNYFRG